MLTKKSSKSLSGRSRQNLPPTIILFLMRSTACPIPCTMKDLFNEQIIAGYTDCLKARGQEKEAEYVWHQFQALSREAREKYEAGEGRS
ncbi:hypothetical protein MCACP_07820 [Neomoorella carbonis]